MKRKVVITGIGIWSCIGSNIEEVKESLCEGRSGIGIDEDRLSYGFRSGLTGLVPTPQLKGMLDRRVRIGLSEEAAYAYMASKDAFEMSGIDDNYLLKNEVGVIFGNDSSSKAVVESASIMKEKRDSTMIGSGLIFQGMNSTVNMNMSTIFHLRGANFSISSACASGSHSIGIAYMLIRQGLQDIMLCGGAQEVNKYAMSSFDALGVFSIRMSEPTKASRPFDRDRDGLVPSGGAAALILEDYEHAVNRGARIVAEVCGYGFSSNGGGISEPSVEGSAISMKRAMADAGIKANDIDYISAHATSTIQGDKAEALAIQQLFSGSHVLISSTKSMTGHECWMSGASEAIYSIIMMQNDFVAPNINYDNPDLFSEPLNISRKTINANINIVLSNSFGFGGTNSSIILKNTRK